MTAIIISKAERSYIQTSLQAKQPLRADGRALLDYRTVLLETGVVPLANGSAKLNIGKSSGEGGGGTEILAATKLEVEDIENGEGVEGGRITCAVTCSPSAYPHLSSNALDDLQHDYTTIIHQTLSHPSLHPPNLSILPKKRSWLLSLDLVVVSDSGNVSDALFMAARAALWDTKVPRTRAVQYRAKPTGTSSGDNMQIDPEKDQEMTSGFDTRQMAATAADFELPDYWDEGEPLGSREKWPVCVTMNILPPTHFLDATLHEEASVPLRLLLAFSFPPGSSPSLQAMRLLGPGELDLSLIKSLITDGEKYAKDLFAALEAKLREEDTRRNVKGRTQFVAAR